MAKNNNIQPLDKFHVYVMENSKNFFFYDVTYEKNLFLRRFRKEIVGAWRLKK